MEQAWGVISLTDFSLPTHSLRQGQTWLPHLQASWWVFFYVPSSVQGPQSCSCPTRAWNRVWVSGFLLSGPVPRSHPPWSCPSPLLLLTPGFKFSLISDTWGFLFLPFKLSCTLKKRGKKSWFPFWSAPCSSSGRRLCVSAPAWHLPPPVCGWRSFCNVGVRPFLSLPGGLLLPQT